MEHVNQVVNFLSRLTEAEKKQANAVTGGNFEKLLVESKVIHTTFAEKNWTKSSIKKLVNFRAYDIRNIFFFVSYRRNFCIIKTTRTYFHIVIKIILYIN